MITCNEIRDKIRKWETFSISPDRKKFPHYNPGYIFDVDKSVRWNREQVDIANKARTAESTRLIAERNKLYDQVVDIVKAYIVQEANCNQTELNIIYNYVTEHDSYTDDFIDTLDEVIELYNHLKVAQVKVK